MEDSAKAGELFKNNDQVERMPKGYDNEALSSDESGKPRQNADGTVDYSHEGKGKNSS